MKKYFIPVSIFALILTVFLPSSDAQPYLKAKPEDMKWWSDARFGMFVHWGPVSLKGTEIGWSRGGERRGIGGTGEIPVEEYDNLYKKFNPVDYDPVKWVQIAKDAGMKYIVFTSKHHDGFCEFDSKLTDYKITSPESPYGKDIVAALAKACHEAGIRLGFYYSPVDFYHPDFRTANHAEYIKYMHGQVRELLSNYGKIDIMWFDGLQIHPMSGTGGDEKYPAEWAKEWDSQSLFKTMRTLQPHLIVNNRCGLEGDFDTPEQHVGFFQTDRPWESCITICNQWAWKPDDTMKSLEECVRTLVTCAGGDGNLLFNVGPMPNGEIEPRQVERLKEIGEWLKVNGESVYGTRGGPVPPQSWGVTTNKGDKVFLHVFTGDTVAIPKLKSPAAKAYLMNGSPVEFISNDTGTIVRLPETGRDPVDTVVVLELAAKNSKK